jgi:hypothetical protein
MSTRAAFIKLAMAFPESDSKPHFDRTAFRVQGKIFATLHPSEPSANLKLSLEDQYVYSTMDVRIYPVTGGWGRMGFTTVEFSGIHTALLKEMLGKAYHHVGNRRKKK